MPLSEPVAREPLHTRRIVLQGYHRADGLFDVEAFLTDTKAAPINAEERGVITPGEPLHGMSLRMTVDEDMLIVAFEAVTDYAPFAICPDAAANFSALAGIRIGRGFVRAAMEKVGGVHGCTHLREVLQQMATVAFQSLYPVRQKRAAATTTPPLLNTCYAYSSDNDVVRRRWPEHYTGTAVREPEPL